MHAGDQSLSPSLPAWSLDLMMSVTPSTCPRALPLHPELHVLPEQQKKGVLSPLISLVIFIYLEIENPPFYHFCFPSK